MRILATGRDGQVARSLVERANVSDHEIVTIGRPELDLEDDPETIIAALLAARPDAIVSAAAYTAVDKAESERERAFRVNDSGARSIASAAAALSVPLVHLSTDYVFDGNKGVPYIETDPPAPMGVYGASKLNGERAVLETHPNSAILRTAWVYSPFGTNFLKTMLRLSADRDEIAVVSDQRGSPTSALDIADGIVAVVENLASSAGAELRGIFHLTSDGEACWAEFAEEIFARSGEFGGPTARVRHIGTADYPTAARRPFNSRLDCSKLARTHGVRLPNWRSSLGGIVQRLVGPEARI